MLRIPRPRTLWRFLILLARHLGGSGAVHFLSTATKPLTLSEAHTAARLLRSVKTAEAAELEGGIPHPSPVVPVDPASPGGSAMYKDRTYWYPDDRKRDTDGTLAFFEAPDDALAHFGIHATDRLCAFCPTADALAADSGVILTDCADRYQLGDVVLLEPALQFTGGTPQYVAILAGWDGPHPVVRFDGPEPWGTQTAPLARARILGYVVMVEHGKEGEFSEPCLDTWQQDRGTLLSWTRYSRYRPQRTVEQLVDGAIDVALADTRPSAQLLAVIREAVHTEATERVLSELILPRPVAVPGGAIPTVCTDPEFQAICSERKTNRDVIGCYGVWPQDDSLAYVGIHETDEVTFWPRQDITYLPGDVLLIEPVGQTEDPAVPASWLYRTRYAGVFVRMEGDQPVLRYAGPSPWGEREIPLPLVEILGYAVSVCHAPIMGRAVCGERWSFDQEREWRWCRSVRNGWRPCLKYLTEAERNAVEGALQGDTASPIKAALNEADGLIDQRERDEQRGPYETFKGHLRRVLLAGLADSGWDTSPIKTAANRVDALTDRGESHKLRLITLQHGYKTLRGGVVLGKDTVALVDESLPPVVGDVVYARIPWMGATSQTFGILGQDEQGPYLAATERDMLADRLRSYKVVGVVTKLLANKREAAAYAAYRGVRWRSALTASGD